MLLMGMGRPVSSVGVVCMFVVTFLVSCLRVCLPVMSFERVAFDRFSIRSTLCVLLLLLLFCVVLFFVSTLPSVLFDHCFNFNDFFHGGHGVHVSRCKFN